ncbi:pathogenesis-related protein 1-like [Beta vulgaris subsp. vulgaris]|uniref:pathogenesis-related protein 1-like n=1 Tax=Beta vulgaris subsp. vulgaris TaxID=3555 RepID=UPI0025474663|nr:pathogenesis-related protein 1-like [Beta vulgaris subsp. vulgaris]
MAFSNFTLVIVLVSGLTMAHFCWARPPLDWKLKYLVAHNTARLKALQPPLVWNDTVAAFARSYAKRRSVDCKLEHSHNPILGENIAMSTGDLSPVQAVDLWVGEKPNYDIGANVCKKMCGHFTQIVWRKTRSIGCAKERCRNGGTFITCNYYPPGNVIGERPF